MEIEVVNSYKHLDKTVINTNNTIDLFYWHIVKRQSNFINNSRETKGNELKEFKLIKITILRQLCKSSYD